MAIVTSVPSGKEAQVTLYDIPDSELQKYKVEGSQAAQMYPDQGGVSSAKAKSVSPAPEMTSDVQGYSDLCICSGLLCNGYGVCIYGSCYCDCTSEICL